MVDRSAFEAGDEPLAVERRPRAGVVVSVRLSPEEADRLEGLAESRRMTLSQVVREAISMYLRSGPPAAAAGSPWTATTFNEMAPLTVIATGYGAVTRTRGPDVSVPAPRK
jgi:hypothetical protein